MIALTPSSPFRPRRWRGAILPEKMVVRFEVLDPVKRPVSAVGDQREVRDVACVDVAIDRSTPLTLLFDPEHARSEEHTSELQSLMSISYAVCCLKKTKHKQQTQNKT